MIRYGNGPVRRGVPVNSLNPYSHPKYILLINLYFFKLLTDPLGSAKHPLENAVLRK